MRNFRWYEEEFSRKRLHRPAWPADRPASSADRFMITSRVFYSSGIYDWEKERKRSLALRHLKGQHQARKEGLKKLSTDDIIDFSEKLEKLL